MGTSNSCIWSVIHPVHITQMHVAENVPRPIFAGYIPIDLGDRPTDHGDCDMIDIAMAQSWRYE